LVRSGGLGAVGHVAALRVPLRFGWARQGGPGGAGHGRVGFGMFWYGG